MPDINNTSALERLNDAENGSDTNRLQLLDDHLLNSIFSNLSVKDEVGLRAVSTRLCATVDEFRAPNVNGDERLSAINACFELPRLLEFLSEGGEPFALPADMNYAFHQVCERNMVKAAETLIAYRGPNDERLDVSRGVEVAARYGRADIVDLLLADEHCDPAIRHNEALRTAISWGHVPVMDRLLADHRVDVTADNQFPLRWAVEHGHPVALDRILNEPSVDPAVNQQFPIRWAARIGRVENVHRLLDDHRVDPSAGDQAALRYAARNGHTLVVDRLLLDNRVDPTVNNNQAYRVANERNRLGVVNRLREDPRVIHAMSE